MPTSTDAAPAVPRDFLRACVLLLLRERRAHGYDLLDQLASLGFARSDPGRLYRTLRALEAEECVYSAWEGSKVGPDRRIYTLTRTGAEELHRRAQGLVGAAELMRDFLARYGEWVALRRSTELEALVAGYGGSGAESAAGGRSEESD